MAEAILSIILFFNVVLVIIYFIMRIHKHAVNASSRVHTEAEDEKENKNVPSG